MRSFLTVLGIFIGCYGGFIMFAVGETVEKADYGPVFSPGDEYYHDNVRARPNGGVLPVMPDIDDRDAEFIGGLPDLWRYATKQCRPDSVW